MGKGHCPEVMHERGVKYMRLKMHCGIVSEALVCGSFA